MILAATPYGDLPHTLPVRYLSRHAWTEGPGTVRSRIAAIVKSAPAWAYLVDSEDDRNRGDVGPVVEVLQALAECSPLSERFVYDSQLRVTNPSQRDGALARLAARTGNQTDQDFYAWSTAIVRDVYLMAEPISKATPYAIDHARTERGLEAYLQLNAEVMLQESKLFNAAVWPCVHERYHTGHGAGENIWIPRDRWAKYVAAVRARWPGNPIVWWSGAMEANPGVPGEGYPWPAERHLRRYAESLA